MSTADTTAAAARNAITRTSGSIGTRMFSTGASRRNVATGWPGKTRAVAATRARPAAAGTAKHQALHDQLTRHTPSAGAQRQPTTDLRLSGQRARQHQVRDVGARDQEHQAERRHDEREQGHVGPVEREPRGERVEARGHGRRIGRRRKTLPQPHLEPRAHRRRGHVLSQAPDDHQRRGFRFGPWIGTRKHVRHGQRCPEGHELLAGQTRLRLRDSDHLEALTSQRDSLTDDGWIRAIAGSPGVVRQHDDRRAAATAASSGLSNRPRAGRAPSSSK